MTDTKKLDSIIRSELRSSYAGETGAVWIYRGILFANWIRKDAQLEQFAKEHLKEEQRHQRGFEDIIHLFRGSIFQILWIIAGFVTGLIPGLFGRNWVFYTVYRVESFVDRHYTEQMEIVSERTNAEQRFIVTMLKDFHSAEVAHKNEALSFLSKPPGKLMLLWGNVIQFGSSAAVFVAKRI